MEEKKKDSIYELDGTVPTEKSAATWDSAYSCDVSGELYPADYRLRYAGNERCIKNDTDSECYVCRRYCDPVSAVSVLENRKRTANRNGTSSGFIGTAKAIGAAFGYGA